MVFSGAVAQATQPGWDGSFEHLRFDIRWLFVSAGSSIIQAEPNGAKEATFLMQACTNPTVDFFHRVRDNILVKILRDEDQYRSKNYRYTQSEGGYKRNLEIKFLPDNKITLTDFILNETKNYTTPEPALDIMSVFVKSRSLPLEVGKDYKIPVFDAGKYYRLVVKSLRKESIDTIFGKETPTIVIRPMLQSEGIFQRKGEVTIWLTDNEKRIPVRMETKITIGKIVSNLKGISHRPITLPSGQLLCETPFLSPPVQ